MILVDMQALMEFAISRNSGSHDLAESVNIVRMYVKPFLKLLTHLLGPGLRAVDRASELQLGK